MPGNVSNDKAETGVAHPRAEGASLSDWLVNAVLHGTIRLAGHLPFDTRLRLFSWLTRRIIGRIAPWRKRAIANLAHIYPDMPDARRQMLADEVLDNLGRTFLENYNVEEFRARLASTGLSGPGAADLIAALEAGRPIILAAAHFGNYEAPRSILVNLGYEIGIVYRPASNAYFQRHYHAILENGGGPAFTTGNRGTARLTRYLKSGGAVILAHDLFYHEGEVMPFLGHDTLTATSAARLALKFGALLIPYYGIRCDDGTGFEAFVDAPVDASDPLTMTRELTGGLERQIALHPGQWLWSHRRWPNLRRPNPAAGGRG